MSFCIAQACIGCWACFEVCPNQAIEVTQGRFMIVAALCRECQDDFPQAQCAAICPVEEAILDDQGMPVHPVGSLTGVPPAIRAVAQGISSLCMPARC